MDCRMAYIINMIAVCISAPGFDRIYLCHVSQAVTQYPVQSLWKMYRRNGKHAGKWQLLFDAVDQIASSQLSNPLPPRRGEIACLQES